MRIQDLNRLRQIAVIAAKHGFADVLERSGLWRKLGRKETVEASPEAQRASTAKRFRLLLNELGPTFIKLGQVMSTRADLLPQDYIRELSLLQDSVPPFPIEQVHAQIREGLGREVKELFLEVNPVPLAAASIAQVHEAKTLAGEDVVVKVQRPDIEEQIRSDLVVLRSLAQLLEAVVEETGIYTPTGIVEEFERAIYEELDFIHEAANIREFAANHTGRPHVHIPKVYEALSSPQVLTLERIRGQKLSQLTLSEERRTALARRLIEGSFRQLFEDGLFHGDPHPGNLLIMEGDVVALLDFGLVGRLSKAMQETLVMLSLAVALKDAGSVARLIYRVGIPDHRADLAGFTRDLDGILRQYRPATLKEVSAQSLFTDLFDVAVRYKIRIPKEYAILSRASVAMEGVLRELAPNLNLPEVVMPYAKELLVGKYDPTQLEGGLMRGLLKLQGLATELPVQLSQILLDLESGKFSVQVRSEQLESLNQTLRGMAAVAFMGLCGCGFIVGTFIAFSQSHWMVRGIPVLGMVGLLATGATFGGVLAGYLVFSRLRKVRLTELLKKRRRR
jgi:ubiquinone biosynthesis protein